MPSIQECRERVANTYGKFMNADPAFASSVNSRYEQIKANSRHPADFRRLRNDVQSWAKDFANRAEFNSAKDQGAYDCAIAHIDLLDCEINNLALSVSQLETDVGGEVWRNTRTGQAIKLYTPEERISASQTPANRVGIGELLEGLVMGARSEPVRNALSSGTDSAGGYTVPVEITREFIDKLRAKSVFIRAGARTMMLDGPTRIVKLTGDPNAIWREENASIGDSDITLGALSLEPKSLSTLVKVPYELLQDSVNIADILQQAITAAMATKLDYGCLFGSGTGTEIQGLFGTAGINSVSMGTNGGTPAGYDNMLDMVYELELDNSGEPTAAIWHPRTARTFRKFKDGQNNPLSVPSPIAELPKLSTTAVPIDQTQGTETAASTVLMGDFTQAILGIREQLTIIRLDQTYAANGQVGFWARMRVDVGFAHPESFCKLIGIKP